MRLIYTSRSPKPDIDEEMNGQRVSMETLLRESDFISVHAPLSEETRGMFNAESFAQMKDRAVFVNTARGPIHVESDLLSALESQKIFAAGLDVTDPEPMLPDNPLLKHPRCMVLPHIGSATQRSRNGMAEIAADNLIAGIHNQPLRCEVK
mgnify:CR=1 FL=1